MNLVSVECPSCGATLPARAPSGHYKCDYCGAEFAPQQVKHAHDQAGHAVSTEQLAAAIVRAQQLQSKGSGGANPAVHQIDPGQGAKTVRRVMLLVGLITLASAVVPILIATRSLSGMGGMGGGGGGGGVAVGGGLLDERIMWDGFAGRPIPVTIDGAAAFVGRTRVVLPEDKLYFDAYQTDGTRVWRVDELGSYSDGYQYTLFGVAGDRVVITDKDAKLRVLELSTGEKLHEVALSDRANYICSPSHAPPGVEVEGVEQVWVRQIDEQSYLVDVDSGELTAAGKPTWCPERHWPADSMHETRYAPNEALEVEGAKILRSYVDGDDAVAAAIKSPGTEIPRAIGYDPKTLEVRWDEVVSKVPAASNRNRSTRFSGLAGGRYVAVYGEGQDGWHVAALDAKTGASLWDITLRPLFAVDKIDGLVVSEQNVFVVRTSSLEVLDAKSGELLMTVGSENYD